MKKFLSILLSCTMIAGTVGLAACNSDEQKQPKHEHNYVKQSDVEATCTEGAYALTVCECGESKKEYVKNSKPLGHEFWYYAPDGNKTCTEDGTMTAKCIRCDETETIPDEAFGHVFNYYEYNNDETCTKEGTMTAKCENCDQTHTLPVPALGHSFKNYVSNTDATCTKYGTKTAKCERCDETNTVTSTNSKLPHNYVNGLCTVCKTQEKAAELSYRLIGKEYCVTGIGTVKDNDIVIPAEYNGKPVTSIGQGAFEDCGDITSVTVSDGITSIGSYAFCYCSNLKEITVPDSLTSIGYEAFYGCDSLKKTEYDNAVYLEMSGNPYFFLLKGKDKEVESVTIHNDAKFIAYRAFYQFEQLKSIVISDGVVCIGESAFASCENLSSITLGKGLENIAEGAFTYCSALKSITVPEGVTEIGRGAFDGCYALENISVPNSLEKIGYMLYLYSDEDTIKYTVYDNACYIGNEENPYLILIKAKNDSISSCKIHEKTKFISGYAFYDCEILKSISIPDSVTRIYANAFADCENLTSVTFGKGLKSIGGNAFSYCIELQSVSLPDSVTELGSYAFNDCRALTSLKISKNLKFISDYAFKDCHYLTSVTIPDGVTNIGSGAFESCWELKNVTISDSVISVGKDAFSRCNNLNYNVYDTGAYLGSVSNPYFILIGIGNMTTSCVVHEDTKIIEGAFYGCQKLEKLTIPAGVTLITSGTFTYCYVLNSIDFKGTMDEWENIKKDKYGHDFAYSLVGSIINCTDGKILIENN